MAESGEQFFSLADYRLAYDAATQRLYKVMTADVLPKLEYEQQVALSNAINDSILFSAALAAAQIREEKIDP